MRGVDVSSHQPYIDWERVGMSGIEFAIVKASGGAHYRNPRYTAQIAGARAAGLAVGHYHYAHELSFDPPPRTAIEEAAYFVETIDARPGDLLALDIEDPDAHGNLSPWALDWLEYVETATGCAPLLYTYPYYAIERKLNDPALARYPLWWASYDNPPRVAPAPWSGWTILQHTAFATIPGIGPNVDENRFGGDRAALAALGIPGTVAPAPPFENPDPVTGVWVHEYFAALYSFAAFGRPISPAALYSDGMVRQLFERAVLEGNGRGEARVGGLGQAYRFMAGMYPDWPDVHPLLP